MKVRCIRLLDAFGKPQDKSPWLTIGNIYNVLSIQLGSDQMWKLLLIGDGLNGAALFRLDQFEVVNSKIPSSWTISWSKDGFFKLAPEPWNQPGFWERYYDKDNEAVRVFEKEMTKIILDDRKVRQSELLTEIVNKHCPALLDSIKPGNIGGLSQNDRRIILESLGIEFGASGMGENLQPTPRGLEIEELLNIVNRPNSRTQ